MTSSIRRRASPDRNGHVLCTIFTTMEERTPPLFHVCVIEEGLASDVGCELRTLVNEGASAGRILIADGHPISGMGSGGSSKPRPTST